MFRHRNGLVADTHSPDPFDHEVKLLHLGMAMQSIGAFWRETPKSGAQKLALRALEKIRIGNFHHVGQPPGKVFRLDNKEIFEGCHRWQVLAHDRCITSSGMNLKLRRSLKS